MQPYLLTLISDTQSFIQKEDQGVNVKNKKQINAAASFAYQGLQSVIDCCTVG